MAPLAEPRGRPHPVSKQCGATWYGRLSVTRAHAGYAARLVERPGSASRGVSGCRIDRGLLEHGGGHGRFKRLSAPSCEDHLRVDVFFRAHL